MSGCYKNCVFCYAKKITKRYGLYGKGGNFDPQFHEHKLDEPQKVKQASIVFVCDMGDIFSGIHHETCKDGTSKIWLGNVNKVFEAMKKAPQHQYLFLTKYPVYYSFESGFKRPDSWWCGVSITKAEDSNGITQLPEGNTYIQFEPLLESVVSSWDDEMYEKAKKVNWIIIGKATRHKSDWNKEWVQEILNFATSENIPVFIKNNVGWYKKVRQFPKGLDELAGDLK